jgi:hypothetical protein
MGVLKHVLFPAMTLLHIFGVSIYLTGRNHLLPSILAMPGAENERTSIELHLCAVMSGVWLMLLFCCLCGIFYENSHFRGVVAVMHLILFTNDMYDCATREGWGSAAPTLAIMDIFILVCIIIHSQEPGLFTEDKSTKKD